MSKGNGFVLENRIFDSRVKSKNVTGKEKRLGYLLGPCGALLLNATLNIYLNQYYVDVLGLGALFGGLFIALFPVFSKIIDGVVDILYGYLIDRTKSKQGKGRPWILLCAPLLAITGILLFTVPQADPGIQAIYVVITYNLFYSFAYSIYNMAYNLMVPLSTRNTQQRNLLSVFTQVSTIMISGILVALVFPMVVLPFIGVDKTMWIIVMSIVSTIALPLTLIQYYFTKERITEEKRDQQEKKIPFKAQLKAAFSDKYIYLLMLYFMVYTLGTQFKNLGLVYYSNYVLGTYSDGITQTMISVIGGVPMGIGIFAVWPLVKRFGKKNVTFAGFLIYALGSAICCIAPSDMVIVLIGQFIKNIGGLPCAYVFMALMADCLDNLEWKTGFRSDGVVTATYNIVSTTVTGVGTGLFNFGLSANGYVAPITGEVSSDITNTVQKTIENADGSISTIFNQNDSVINFIVFAFLGFEILTGLISALLIWFMDVEKNISRKQKVLVEREKEEFKKEGKVWLPSDERAAIKQEKDDLEAEEAYKEELVKKCEKEGKDFAKEYAIHLYKKNLKAEKEHQKELKTTNSEKAFNEKMKKKHAERLAKFNVKQKVNYEKHQQKLEEKWIKEKERGERIYQKFQKELGNI